MLKHTSGHKFFQGPNINAAGAGLLISIAEPPEEVHGLAEWMPPPEELAAISGLINQLFPVVRESRELPSIASFFAGDASGPFLLALKLAEIILRDFSLAPQAGMILSQDCEHIRLFVPCDDERTGVTAWIFANEVLALLPRFSGYAPQKFAALLGGRYLEARRNLVIFGLNQSTLALARAALAREIPAYRLAVPGQFVQLGQGARGRRIMETLSDCTSSIGNMLSRDKLMTNLLLHRQGIPTPGTMLVSSTNEALAIARRRGFPLVVKPNSAAKGKGVTVEIASEEQLRVAFTKAAAHQGGVIIERHLTGDDHRLLVVGGRLIAAAKRQPAMVVGDGKKNVRQLLTELNDDPRRGLFPFERLLEKVVFDEEAMERLAAAGLSFDSIPADGQAVSLRGAANISRGGTSVDVTELVHSDNRAMIERAARIIGLEVVGIDFLTPNISRSWKEIPCGVLEVNTPPGLRPHLGANHKRDVVGPIVANLFPGDNSGRVPTVGITGSIGKTTTSQMLARIIAASGRTVALSTTQGAWIGKEQVHEGDVAGGGMARTLLCDPGVDAGVFELARGGLLKSGLGLDALTVGVVLNVHDNHLGVDGLDSRDDLARVKRLVVERAKKLAIINADDPLCLAMWDFAGAEKICLVSMEPRNPALAGHRKSGGMAACLVDAEGRKELRVYESGQLVGAMEAGDIPASWKGNFTPAITNALFAMAIAHGLGIEFAVIKEELRQFQSTPDTNPGRTNFLAGFPFQFCLTWADGEAAVAGIAKFIDQLKVQGKKRLVFCSPGNRPNWYITSMGRAAAGHFDEYICCDWEELRGRPEGEAPALLRQGLLEAGVKSENIRMIFPHDEAMDQGLASALAGDLLVMATYSSCRILRKLGSDKENQLCV